MSVDPAPLTLADFIAWEERQPSKHEFRAGAVYAMAGATDDHNTIVANLIAIVRPALRGSTCRTYANGMNADSRAITPLLREYINPHGRYDLDMESRNAVTAPGRQNGL